ncbi:DEAD/DEAH box helicase [Mesomycoplasma lagogenitalium]|uniref:DEAD/DEAH box helicase n=1 Tax=Mesomycoplasma lagogenitalium TaxID=171286 RepID=A0ABY8LVK1_9BACT|nr:DEAD/DEAH box helicase [Mesomycoplasma lagogenitalium]WGI36451.1 DEAD/DEAH box helicase [Mesomycoplasma lagogenitalium]
MNIINRLTLKKLYNTKFSELYRKLQINRELSNEEWQKILSIGIFLIRLEDKNLQKLGYRLFLLYSTLVDDYKPLYELSLIKGLIPISKFIENNLNYLEKYGNLYTEINSIMNEKFKRNNSYLTIEQLELFEETSKSKSESQIIVAPTSYGKTELILLFIGDNIIGDTKFKKICIISPTKSLLTQTKKRIINEFGYRKIVTYPEMYSSNDDKIIAVLTQERLLKLLQNNSNLKFDLLIIDEAHNLLEEFSNKNTRSIILASVIIICKKRNENIVYKFLTPFLKSKESLKINHISNEIKWYSVAENIKSEMFYFYDIENNKKLLLDQYSPTKDMLIELQVNKLEDDASVVLFNSDRKNIIYLNSPKKLENFAHKLFYKMPKIESFKLKKAANDLREYVHEDYKLANYIEKGIIYHHGSIPESIRYFIEDLYINVPEIKMLIANSTLLEGINIPATRMFILEPYRGVRYLSPSSFKNLVGRVCRFGEIFNSNTGDLKYLLPEIHIVKGEYCKKGFKIENFVKERKILVEDYDKIIDDIKNPLLVNSISDEYAKKKADDILGNISRWDITTDNNSNKAKTIIGKLCFENNINIFNILEIEWQIDSEIKNIKKAQNLDEVFEIINFLFLLKINDDEIKFNYIKRLREIKTQNFYKMLINWRMNNFTLKVMINKMVGYWNKLKIEESKIVYVGKWGDKTWDDKNKSKKYWTDITEKNEYEKVNLAIVRLKEEYDFIDNEIIKFIEILHSLKLIEETLYLKIRYGTDDKTKIVLLNCGISNSLSKLLQEKYSHMFEVDIVNSTIVFSENLVSKMEDNGENGILISEVKINVQNKL